MEKPTLRGPSIAFIRLVSTGLLIRLMFLGFISLVTQVQRPGRLDLPAPITGIAPDLLLTIAAVVRPPSMLKRL